VKVNFTYDKEKDIWCLLNKGKSSNNSQKPTKQYELLAAEYGENPTTEMASACIDNYFTGNKIDIQEHRGKFQKDWKSIANEYQKRAEVIFSTTLPSDVTAYLTVNSRCPYSIENKYFYVSLQSFSVRETAMHELWHFYTWYGLGTDQEEKLGKEKYNDLKEALTVLLNVTCKDLMSEGASDSGYPQHKELREKIAEYWAKDKNIHPLWKSLAESTYLSGVRDASRNSLNVWKVL
jgi:hypothetical protein